MTHSPYILPLSPEAPEHEWTRFEEPTFLRRPRRLALVESGEMVRDDESPGVSAVHWAPLPSRWTDQPPTRPGVYHCRPVDTDEYAFVKVDLVFDFTYGYQPWGRPEIPWQPVPPAPHSGQPAELFWSDRPILEPLEAS